MIEASAWGISIGTLTKLSRYRIDVNPLIHWVRAKRFLAAGAQSIQDGAVAGRLKAAAGGIRVVSAAHFPRPKGHRMMILPRHESWGLS